MRFRSTAPLLPVVCVLLATACGTADARPFDPAPDSAAFVTRLGADTLVVERVITWPERVEAEVMIRTPRTELRTYALERAPDGSMRRMEAVTYDPADLERPVRTDILTFGADSLTVAITRDGETETRSVEGHRGVVPFLDMIHWPYDIVLRQMAAGQVDSLTVDMFAGRRTAPFVFQRLVAGGASITHPSRGTMTATTDAAGRLETLDAGATTRKLTVERKTWIDLPPLVSRFAALDAEGRGFGPLSGRGADEATVGDAHILLDYGTPAKRGREIWGALVPYGEVWRTGANRATHLTTSAALSIGDLRVPAGTYTLYTIPGPDESTLIVNRMTDQGGTTYDAAMDLGRVPLLHRERDSTQEVLDIRIRTVGDEGELVIAWGSRDLAVRVRPG